MKLALPGILMLTIENFNMEILVLLAGLLNNDNLLGACVMLVAFGQFFIMIPYGLSLANVTMVGHSLGANKPVEAKQNAILTMVMSFISSLACAMILTISSNQLIVLYASMENPNLITYAQQGFPAFMIAVLFDWCQCNTSGVIKATGL